MTLTIWRWIWCVKSEKKWMNAHWYLHVSACRLVNCKCRSPSLTWLNLAAITASCMCLFQSLQKRPHPLWPRLKFWNKCWSDLEYQPTPRFWVVPKPFSLCFDGPVHIEYDWIDKLAIVSASFCTCDAVHCIASHYIPFHSIAFLSIALHCITLHSIAFHCIALRCITLHCMA